MTATTAPDSTWTETDSMLIDMHNNYDQMNRCYSLDAVPEILAIGWLTDAADNLSMDKYALYRVNGCFTMRDMKGVLIGGIYRDEDPRLYHAFCYSGR